MRQGHNSAQSLTLRTNVDDAINQIRVVPVQEELDATFGLDRPPTLILFGNVRSDASPRRGVEHVEDTVGRCDVQPFAVGTLLHRIVATDLTRYLADPLRLRLVVVIICGERWAGCGGSRCRTVGGRRLRWPVFACAVVALKITCK